jgi:hypothetical protein
MKDLTQEQKKIIYIAAIIAGSLLAFIIFVYLPQSKRLGAIRRQLNEAEANIADIGQITSGRDLNEAVKDLSAKLSTASKIFPSGEGEVISRFTDIAKKLKLQINTLDPQGEIKLAQSIAGYNLSELPVIINMSGEFRAIGEFLNYLRNDFSALARVKKLSLQGNGEGRPALTANLEISVILAKSK